jgi:UDP-glucose 4-epimerase
MKNIVVFGGSGFLGSYIIDELINKGFNVINADIVPPRFNIDRQVYKKVDILDIESIDSVIDKDTDVVYNFAGLSDINISINNPIQTIELNILGNANILEICKNKSIKRFIYASSAYAFSSKGTFYGISKQTSERIIEEYFNRYGLEFTILRYGSLYGERADDNNGIYRILKQALDNNVIIYNGDGTETREYIHCRDAAKLSVDILDSNYKNKHLLLTGLEKHNFKEILTMVKELLNDSIEVLFTNQEYSGHYKMTPYSFHPTIGEKIVANPYVDIGQGLLECISTIYNAINKHTAS